MISGFPFSATVGCLVDNVYALMIKEEHSSLLWLCFQQELALN